MPTATARRHINRGRSSWLDGYVPLRFSGPFSGFNSYQSIDTIPQGGPSGGIIQTPDSLNVYSYPFGTIASFPGHANLNAVAGNSGKAITGITYLGEISETLVVAIQNKIGKDVAGVWTDITGAASITDSQDNFMHTAYLNGTLVLTFHKEDAPLKWTGTGTVATLGGSPRAGVHLNFSFDGRMWLVSDQNCDYSARNNPESYDLTDDTLNFVQTTGAGASDGSKITSATVVGNSVYIGKGGAKAVVEHVFRIYRTGNEAVPYAFERIETGGVGPTAHLGSIEMGQDFVFLAKDGNVYLIRGNEFIPGGIGRNIQRTILADYSKSRFEFASMGLLRERGLLGLSLSLSGGTTNSRTWWYDYLNSRPGNPKYEFWHPGDQAINAWGERISSGGRQLITGGYDGFYEQQLSGDSFAGAAFTKRWTGPWHLLGDPSQVYHILGVLVVFEPVGNFNVTFKYGVDFSSSFTTSGTFNTTGAAEFGSAVFGTSVFGGTEQGVAYLTLNAVARRLRPQFVNLNASEPFNISSYIFLVKPLYRGINF